jgi:TUG ubiquitin-like domain
VNKSGVPQIAIQIARRRSIPGHRCQLLTRMASNVVVLHNNRRYVVKTTPSMLCREILVQACDKIGIKSFDNLGLKYQHPFTAF